MASSYPMLRYGSSGQEVRRLQQALNRAGYSLEVDGGFGEKTRAALMDYQRRAGMTPDGVAGSKTWASLGLQSAQDRLADLEKGYNPSRETQREPPPTSANAAAAPRRRNSPNRNPVNCSARARTVRSPASAADWPNSSMPIRPSCA